MLSQRVGTRIKLCFVAAALAAVGSPASAQLVITEYLADTLGANDDNWEWFEVRNTGASPIDLNGYIGARLNDLNSTNNISIDNSLGGGVNTIIPAGGVAVIYDGDSAINAVDFDVTKYRSAWGLAPSVQVIPARNWPALTNGAGTAFGFWADPAAFADDLAVDDMDRLRVSQFTNAAFSLDFRPDNGFPAIGSGVSNTWNGSGSYQVGGNWAPSVAGSGGAVTSQAVTIPGSTNSTDDVGSPGLLPPGTAPAGFWITEIMFDPRSDETNAAWEWVEVYNNTGVAIDFGTNPGVIDDDDDAAKTVANLTVGIIPNGTAAVIYNGFTNTLSDMQAAWDPGGTLGTNFIGTTGTTSILSWTGGLTNGGDRVGIWPSLAAYQSEAVTTGGNARTMANARTSVAFDDATTTSGLNVTGVWPDTGDGGSIAVFDLSLVSNNANGPTDGNSWVLSGAGDTLGSFNAAAIPGAITIHPGGDVGSPGVFGAVVTTDPDFDNVNGVDGADLLIWQRGLGSGTTNAQGDADGDGDVDAADLAIVRAAFGTPATAALGAVPEPTGAVLAAFGMLAVAGIRRRRG